MKVSEVLQKEYAPFYATYISKVPDGDYTQVLKDSSTRLRSLILSLPDEHGALRYEPSKWTIKEVLQHIIDAERVFAYRAFRISRGDQTALAGFDQNTYIGPSRATQKSFSQILNEYDVCRNATRSLFYSLHSEDLLKMGTASDFSISSRALFFIICGHEIHHRLILENKYLPLIK